MPINRTVSPFRIAIAAASFATAIAVSCTAARAEKYKVFYRFMGGEDGSGPTAPPVRDADGNLYGITAMAAPVPRARCGS